jgi:hypothetical protein
MIGTRLLSASNVLDVLIESGDWQKDEKLKQVAIRLRCALDAADQLPELQDAYRETVNAYTAYITRTPEVSQ